MKGKRREVVDVGSVCAAVEGRGSPGAVVDGGMGESEQIARRASAATIPPIECPTKTVWTEGSIVGDGVEAATSRSMTLFCSLKEKQLSGVRATRYVMGVPFSKPPNALL